MNIVDIIPLPLDITNLILEFSGYHRLRNKKYMVQLNLNSRLINQLYQDLLTRPQMKNGFVILHFSDETTIALFLQTYNMCSGYNNRL
jgi:hypothetical protein